GACRGGCVAAGAPRREGRHPFRDRNDMSTVALAKKLDIIGDAAEAERVFTVFGAPDGFQSVLGDHGAAVWQHSLLAPLDVVIAFFSSRAALLSAWPRLTAPLVPAGAVWVAFPRRSDGERTGATVGAGSTTGTVIGDLTGDVLRATLLRSGWVDDKMVSIDAHWSAMRFMLRKELRPGERSGKRPRDRRR
ncbi:MAG: hypothetical protein ABIQ39_11680, partial [Ilumatobacteraceae bacterium]